MLRIAKTRGFHAFNSALHQWSKRWYSNSKDSCSSKPSYRRASGEIQHATSEEVNQAVAAAKAALSDWSEASIAQRTKLLYKFRNLVLEMNITSLN